MGLYLRLSTKKVVDLKLLLLRLSESAKKSVYLVTFLESLLLQIQRITLRQNGKHRRPRPREGRVGDVRPPGSKLPEHGQPGSTRGGATRLSASARTRLARRTSSTWSSLLL